MWGLCIAWFAECGLVCLLLWEFWVTPWVFCCDLGLGVKGGCLDCFSLVYFILVCWNVLLVV